MTNTNEGELFVNASTANTVQTPSYIANLFPRLSLEKAQEGAKLYVDLGTPIQQANTVMAEGTCHLSVLRYLTLSSAIFVCPTYLLLKGFRSRPTFKVILLLPVLIQFLNLQGEFAIPPGSHGNDVAYYIPT